MRPSVLKMKPSVSKTNFTLPAYLGLECFQLPTLYAGVLWPKLAQVFVFCHNSCDFICAAALLYMGDTVPLVSYTTSGSYSLSALSSSMLPGPRGMECNTDVPFRNDHSTNLHSLHLNSCWSMCWLLSATNKAPFLRVERCTYLWVEW